MIAYHFPPFSASTGIQRTLGFARHLPAFGWEPLILTAHPRAYDHASGEHLRAANDGMIVERAFALDASRQLAVKGRYPAFLARPDRWSSWWLGAVPKGLAMIRRYRPQAIWSTYPIATAHKIAGTLQRLSRLPWIADFRDPMAQDGYPADRKTWKSFKRIEEQALRTAVHSVFVTRGAAQMYQERYADVPEARIAVIENGYDEQSFESLDASRKPFAPGGPRQLTLLHSGVVYPRERDPTQLFHAVRDMLNSGELRSGELKIRLRAPVHEAELQRQIAEAGVQEVVELAPSIPYREALVEMMQADGLLVLQAASCNQQVPAKLYEYLRCGRPIIALTDPAGETAALMQSAGLDDIAPLDSVEAIARRLRAFLGRLRAGTAPLPDAQLVTDASRHHRTVELAGLLDELR